MGGNKLDFAFIFQMGVSMNRRLLAASLMAAFTTGVHVFMGGADIASPLLESTLAAEPRLTLYAVWHMASITLGLSAIAYFIAGLPRHEQSSRSLVVFVSALWLGFALIFVVIALIQPENGWLLKLPQWVLLAPVGLLGLWGSPKPPRSMA
jgi:hypothetical protein